MQDKSAMLWMLLCAELSSVAAQMKRRQTARNVSQVHW